jgi:hypothetical protein
MSPIGPDDDPVQDELLSRHDPAYEAVLQEYSKNADAHGVFLAPPSREAVDELILRDRARKLSEFD